MISDGLFGAQLNSIQQILDVLGIFEERQRFPNKDLGAARFRGMNYRQVYEEYVREYAYDFRLSDQSLVLFVKGGNNEHDGMLSYSYLDCPVRVMTYREFVGSEVGIDATDELFDEKVIAWGDDLRPEYEQYINSLDAKTQVTPIRYDYKSLDYRSGIHPASHMHIGFQNEMRLSTRRIMKPLSFAMFLLRQRYPKAWEKLRSASDFSAYCRNVREDLDLVDDEYWTRIDEQELALH